MEIIDISKRQFNKLKKLELEDEISNDEGEIFLFNNINWKYGKNEFLYKKFYTTDRQYFANKLYTITMLKDYEKSLGIKELVIPQFLTSIDGNVNGVLIKKIDADNLGLVLNNPKIDKKEKLKYMKMLGELINKVHTQEVLPFVFGDLHPYNFMIDRDKDKLYAIDLDAVYLNTNYPPGTHYLFINDVIGDFPNKYESNAYGVVTPTKDTDLLCYTFMLLNVIAGFGSKTTAGVNGFSIEDYYMYVTYLEKLGFGKDFIKCIRSVYSNRENDNPYFYLDDINMDRLGEASYSVYKYKMKR